MEETQAENKYTAQNMYLDLCEGDQIFCCWKSCY